MDASCCYRESCRPIVFKSVRPTIRRCLERYEAYLRAYPQSGNLIMLYSRPAES